MNMHTHSNICIFGHTQYNYYHYSMLQYSWHILFEALFFPQSKSKIQTASIVDGTEVIVCATNRDTTAVHLRKKN